MYCHSMKLWMWVIILYEYMRIDGLLIILANASSTSVFFASQYETDGCIIRMIKRT